MCFPCVDNRIDTNTNTENDETIGTLAGILSLGHAVFSSDSEDSSAMKDIPRLTCSLHVSRFSQSPPRSLDGSVVVMNHEVILVMHFAINQPIYDSIRVFEEDFAFDKAF